MKNNDLINYIENALLEKERNKERKNNGKFYPSSVGQCSRKIVYSMLNYKADEKDIDIIKIMNHGTLIHEMIEKMFYDAGLLISNETSFVLYNEEEGKEEEILCSGRSDAIIKNFRDHISSDNIIKVYKEIHLTNKDGTWQLDENNKPIYKKELVYEGPDNDIVLIEIKSIKEKKYQKLLPKTKPEANHELQLQLYLKATQIKNGIVFYVCKDNQKFLQFDVNYNEELANKAINQAKFCNYCRDNNVLPQREFEKESIECMYCDYLQHCYPDMYELKLARKNISNLDEE